MMDQLADEHGDQRNNASTLRCALDSIHASHLVAQ